MPKSNLPNFKDPGYDLITGYILMNLSRNAVMFGNMYLFTLRHVLVALQNYGIINQININAVSYRSIRPWLVASEVFENLILTRLKKPSLAIPSFRE